MLDFKQLEMVFGHGQAVEEVRKALTLAGTNKALVVETILPDIIDLTKMQVPELDLFTPISLGSDENVLRILKELGVASVAIGETAAYPESTSEWDKSNVFKGRIGMFTELSDFLKKAADPTIDPQADAMSQSIRSMALGILSYIFFGNKLANPWEFNGILTSGITNYVTTSSSIEGSPLNDVGIIKSILNAGLKRGVDPNQIKILMSPDMQDHIGNLNTAGVPGIQRVMDVNFKGGVSVGQKANFIGNSETMLSTRTSPMSLINSQHVTPLPIISKEDSGGTVQAGEYFMTIEGITEFGEQLASAEVSITAINNVSKINLDWTSMKRALWYWVFVGTTTGETYLKDIIPANAYDPKGAVAGKMENYVFSTDPMVAKTSVPSHMRNFLPKRAYEVSPGKLIVPEDIIIFDKDPIQGIGGFVHLMSQGPLRSLFSIIIQLPEVIGLPLIRILFDTYGGALCANGENCAWIRSVLPIQE